MQKNVEAAKETEEGTSGLLHEESQAAVAYLKYLKQVATQTFGQLIMPIGLGFGMGVSIVLIIMILSGHFK